MISAFPRLVSDFMDEGHSARQIMEDGMLEMNHERAAYLHMYAAQAHAAAASAHRRFDHEKAFQLSETAQIFSSSAGEKTEEIENKMAEQLGG